MSLCTITLSAHAIERFQQRVRPCLTTDEAADELARLLTLGDLTSEAPGWFADLSRQTTDAFVVLGDIVLPLVAFRDELVATTCIARGGISDRARARRNARRHGRRFTR